MPADTVAVCTVEPLAPFGAGVRPVGSRPIPGAA